MRITQILAAAVFVALGLGAQSAQAVPMIATWTGTVSYSQFVRDVSTGDAAQITFSFDTDNLGPTNTFAYNSWSNYFGPNTGANGFYTTVTYTLGIVSGSLNGANTYPNSKTSIASGGTDNYYSNYVEDGGNIVSAQINFGSPPFVTNGDPAQTFNVNPSAATAYLFLFNFNTFLDITNVTVSSVGPAVPAPGALALLGLGLLGIGGFRRNRKAA